MDISKYTTLFHDGSLLAIMHTGKQLILSLESAEVDEENVKGYSIISKDGRIRGKLHIEGIKKIKENGQNLVFVLRMKDKDAEIFHFEINAHEVEFQIKWNSSPPRLRIEDFSTIRVEAEKIWWENIPNLDTFYTEAKAVDENFNTKNLRKGDQQPIT